MRLDYAFVPQPFSGRIVRCNVRRHVAAARASDRCALVVDIDTSVRAR